MAEGTSDGLNAQGAPGESGDGDQPAAGDNPPKWWVNAQKETEKRVMEMVQSRLGDMGRQMAKLRDERRGEGQGDARAPKPVEGGDSRADAVSAMRLGRLQAQLPEAAQKRLESMIADERPLGEILLVAETLHETLGEVGKPSEPQAKTGHGGTPAPNTPPAFVGTVAELKQLKESDPKAYQKVIDHPDFDLNRLRYNRR